MSADQTSPPIVDTAPKLAKEREIVECEGIRSRVTSTGEGMRDRPGIIRLHLGP